MTSISAFQGLLDAIEHAVWQRDADGRLTWVNQAYGEAVEAVTPDEARSRRPRIPGHGRARDASAHQRRPNPPFHDKISTVVGGNRTFFDVVDVAGAERLGRHCRRRIAKSRRSATNCERTLKSHAETLDHLGTPVAIFDGDARLQFYNQAFVQLWELDIGFLETQAGQQRTARPAALGQASCRNS